MRNHPSTPGFHWRDAQQPVPLHLMALKPSYAAVERDCRDARIRTRLCSRAPGHLLVYSRNNTNSRTQSLFHALGGNGHYLRHSAPSRARHTAANVALFFWRVIIAMVIIARDQKRGWQLRSVHIPSSDLTVVADMSHREGGLATKDCRLRCEGNCASVQSDRAIKRETQNPMKPSVIPHPLSPSLSRISIVINVWIEQDHCGIITLLFGLGL